MLGGTRSIWSTMSWVKRNELLVNTRMVAIGKASGMTITSRFTSRIGCGDGRCTITCRTKRR